MRWWPFGRSGGGRHAFGAAVTSIPSGPLALPLPAPAVHASPVVPAVLAEVLPDLADGDGGPRQQLEALLEMLGGDAVAPGPVAEVDLAPAPTGSPAPPVRTEAVAEPVAVAGPVEPTVVSVSQDAPAPAGAPVPEPAPAGELPFVVVPVQAPAPFVPPGPPVLAPELLAAVGEPRVELGFRDGSTTALQPGSEQARALEDLARLLTSR